MKYIIAVGKTKEEIQTYLGFSAKIIKSSPSRKNGTVALISVDDIDTSWQSSRLASGLLGGRVYNNLESDTDRKWDYSGAENDYASWAM